MELGALTNVHENRELKQLRSVSVQGETRARSNQVVGGFHMEEIVRTHHTANPGNHRATTAGYAWKSRGASDKEGTSMIANYGGFGGNDTTTLINATPHTINIVGADWEISIPTSIPAPRVEMETAVVGHYHVGDPLFPKRIPIRNSMPGKVVGLPGFSSGVKFIVSRMVAEACPDRNDLLVPDGALRDESGRIVGCTGLAKI